METLEEYIQSNKKRFLEELFGLIRIPSVSSDREYGIKVAMQDSGGAAVFELKVPRKVAGKSVGLSRVANKFLEMGVETLKGRTGRAGSSSSEGGDSRGGGEGRRNGGGGRGMRGGMRGGGRGEGGEDSGEPRTRGGDGGGVVTLALRVHLTAE